MPSESLTIIMSLLFVASAVAVLTRNLVRIPYTVALVVVGMLIGFTDLFESIDLGSLHLSKELILVLFVPPLIFEGALNMDVEILQRNALAVFLLAFIGTVLSTFLIGIFAHYFLGFDWMVSLLLGAIISPTDPVSVIAIFREQNVHKDLSIIVEGESVFNDGLGVVLYLIILQAIMGGPVSASYATRVFVWEVVAGAACGFALGYLAYRLLARIDDHLVEVTISILLAFGAYLVADRMHSSGIIAVVLAGLIIGSYGQIFSMSAGTRLALTHFWEVIAFIINSILFLLMGIDLESPQLFSRAGHILAIFGFMIAVRFVLVFGFAYLFSALRKPWPASWKWIVSWGGLKGSIPVALALGIPWAYPQRQEITVLVFGVVLLSLLLQGISFPAVLRKFLARRVPAEEMILEELFGKLAGANASIKFLDDLRNEGLLPSALYDRKLEELQKDRQELELSINAIFDRHPGLRRHHLAKLDKEIAKTRLAALDESLRKGILNDDVVDRLAKSIQVRLAEVSQELEPGRYDEDQDL